jgi:hypothetical protein
VAELADRIHRSWIDFLLAADQREIAALIADANVYVLDDEWGGSYGVCVDLSPTAALFCGEYPENETRIRGSLAWVIRGHLNDQNGNSISNPTIELRIRLMEPEDNWRQVVQELIVNAKNPNQGGITEKLFVRDGKQPYNYNEMKFGSQGEIRIAQELERNKVLFFPLPLAVRSDTGNLYQDHREPDFLVCNDGVCGILEVAHHQPDRYERDKEKDAWWKRSGILCVEHYTWERCMDEPRAVVAEFLATLAKHRRL